MAITRSLCSFLTLLLMLAMLLSLCSPVVGTRADEGLELLFHQRSQSDWEDVWHRETHSRCRDKIIRQLYWACEKDIYRLTRRNRKRNMDQESLMKRMEKREMSSNWWRLDVVNSLLRTRRSNSQTITSECCTKVGCTWEEYAEYCPSNKRRNHY